MCTKQQKIPQQHLCSGISKAADRKVPLTDLVTVCGFLWHWTLMSNHEIRVLKWNTLKLRNQWHRSEERQTWIQFSHFPLTLLWTRWIQQKCSPIKDWLPEFEWVTSQSLHGQQRRDQQNLSSRKTWVTFKRCCSSLLIRKEACGEYCRLRQSNFEIPN